LVSPDWFIVGGSVLVAIATCLLGFFTGKAVMYRSLVDGLADELLQCSDEEWDQLQHARKLFRTKMRWKEMRNDDESSN